MKKESTGKDAAAVTHLPYSHPTSGKETRRRTGIEIIGDVPWGTHFCQFYSTKEDLLDILVPYFKAGLENNEYCMWVTSAPLSVEDATAAMNAALPDYKKFAERGQIEIIPYDHWYTKGGSFHSDRVLRGWVEKHDNALKNGFCGLRLTGNTMWLEKNGWQAFTDYEAEVNNVIGDYKMIALCTYSLDKCNASEIIDVVVNHQFALIKRGGKWEIIEGSEHQKAESELRKSEERFSSLYSAMTEGVALHDIVYDGSGKAVDYVITDVNPVFEKFTGLKKEDAEGKKASELYGTGTAPYLEIYAKVAESGVPASFDTYFSPMKKHFHISVFSPGKGRFATIFQDVTDRRLAEQEIEHLASFPQMNPNPIIELDTEGSITYHNPAAAKVLAEMGLKSGPKAFLPDDLPEILETLKKLKEKKTIRSEINIKDRIFGETIHLSEKPRVLRIYAYDLTERKRAEEALRETTDYLDNLLNYANAPIIVWDPSFKITKFNQAFERLTGIKAGEAIGKNLGILFPDKSRDESMSLIKDTFSGERWEIVEIPILNRDGSVRTVLWNSANISGPDGSVIATIAQGQDITERKNAEDALRKSEQRFSTTLSSIGDAVIATDTKGKITFMNRIAEKLTGWSLVEAAGKDVKEIFNIINEHSRKVVDNPVTKVLEQGAIVGLANHTILVRKDGSHVPIDDSGAPIKNRAGITTGVVLVFRDITERKKAEEKLRETTNYLDSLLNYANAPIIVWDLSFKITKFNCAFERLTGIKAEEAIGKKLDILFPDESRDESMGLIKDTFSGERWEIVEIPILNRDGSVRTVLWNSANISGPDGSVIATIAQGQDITERKHAEEALAKEKANLQSIFDVVNVGMLLIDKNGIVKEMNNTVSGWIGKDLSNCRGKQPGDILGCIHAVSNPKGCGNTPHCAACPIRNSFESVLSTGKPVHGIETESMLSINGKEVRMWLEASADPLEIDGKRQAVLAISDISERKRKEEELRKLNRMLKALSDSNQAMMRASDEKEYLNEVCRIIVEDCGHAMVWIGYAENDEEKTVRPVAYAGFEEGYLESLRITWDDNARGRGPTGTAVRTGAVAVCPNMRTDPRFAPWRKEALKRGYASSIAIPLIEAGRPFGAITIYSKEPDSFTSDEVKLLTELAGDLSYGISSLMLKEAHSEAEESIREARDYLDNLLNYANAPIIVWDPSFRITRFNHAFERLTGLKAAEVIGKNLEILFPEKSKKESMDLIKNTLSGERWEVVEIPILRVDGETRTVLWNSANIHEKAGWIVATIAQGQDITERKKMEDALRESEEQLRESLKEKETLLKEVHHRVKNNLQVISSLMRLQARNIKDKEAVDLFRQSQNRIKTIALIHEKLYQTKDFLHIDMKKYVYDLTANLFHSYIPDRSNISLKTDVKDVSLDVDQIIDCGLIINELVSNSLKYAFPGERKGEISITMKKTGPATELIVSDDGIGIPKDVDYRNIGKLGLQLVVDLVEKQLNGKIELDRKKGTKFIISFNNNKQ